MYKDKLKELRERNEITQEKLADVIKISRGSYGHYENEDDIFPIKTLNHIANYFDISLDYLFGLTEIQKYKNSNDMNLDKSVKRIKEFRKENKLTQVKLAKMLNIANGTIANYECGRNFIATSFLYSICKTYSISSDYLLGKIDNPKYIY